MTNPIFLYAGPDAPAVAMTVYLHDGTLIATRGVHAFLEVSAAEAGQTFTATGGRQAWFNLPVRYDVEQIYTVVFGGDTFQAIKAQRVIGSRGWNTVHAILQWYAVETPAPARRDFGPDFGPDFG